MFKSKLQEYCQSKAWCLPEYGVTKEGLDHCPKFKAVVEVNGISFASPDSCRSVKEAQNFAAKLAYEYLTGCLNSMSASSSIQHPETQETSPVASCDGAEQVTGDNNMFKDMSHIYKNQLQIYAQKKNLDLPLYAVEKVGPYHASRFKSKVTIDGKTYESNEFFRTIKEAETAAAKVALASLFPAGFQENDPFIYKNLLQELLQREYSCLPKYSTSQVGLAHVPVFVSTVEIQGEIFKGQEAKTKKQAEMNVAKVAFIALKERRCKLDDNVNVVQAHVKETPELSSANIPEVGVINSSKNVRNDAHAAQPMSDKQVECGQDSPNSTRMPGATSNSGSTPVLKFTPSAPGPSSSNNPSSSINSEHVNGSNVSEKKKKKIVVRPRSSTGSPANPAVMHGDDKWIAYTQDS